MSLIVTFMVNSGLSSRRMVLMPLLSRLLTLLVILTMPLFLARLTLIPIKSLSICFRVIDRKSGSAGMPRPISYAVFCLKKTNDEARLRNLTPPEADCRKDDRQAHVQTPIMSGYST